MGAGTFRSVRASIGLRFRPKPSIDALLVHFGYASRPPGEADEIRVEPRRHRHRHRPPHGQSVGGSFALTTVTRTGTCGGPCDRRSRSRSGGDVALFHEVDRTPRRRSPPA